jgi:hypothetical protein
MFEAPEAVLRRDPSSLLASLCDPDPPLLADREGFFFFERDWWVFRHVLAFLRDGALPEDRGLLAQLYREAAFWHVRELQRAIEERKLHLHARVAGGDRGEGWEQRQQQHQDEEQEQEDAARQWWRRQPSWQAAVQQQQQQNGDSSRGSERDTSRRSSSSIGGGAGRKADWWLDTHYEGRVYLPLSADPVKVSVCFLS